MQMYEKHNLQVYSGADTSVIFKVLWRESS